MKMLVYLLFGLLVLSVHSDECPVMDDIVLELEGYISPGPLPCMYSGFVNVDEPTQSNLYYWFYRDEDLDENAPLILWLNGGPGASSQIGNFMENGPLRLVKNVGGDIEVHSLTGTSWTAVGNMLYLDQPIGVGYSYGDLKYTSMSQVRQYTLKFMKGFYLKHPEMKDRDFYITGESYGGKYLPNIADEILMYNKKADSEDEISLKALIVGNGFVDPLTQRLSIRHLSLSLGTIQMDALPELDILEKRCEEAAGAKRIDAPKVCADIGKFIGEMDGGMDLYDARWPASNSSSQEEMLNEYLNRPAVVTQLHADVSTRAVKYTSDSEEVYESFLADGMIDYIDLYQKLLEAELPILLYVGNMDRRDGPIGVQAWMKKLKWKHMNDFYASSRFTYHFSDDATGQKTLGGNCKQYKNLNLLMVYNAGHLVPSTQLALSRQMLLDMVKDQKLKCHLEDDDCSLDEISCDYMYDCNGKGTCENGKCVKCDDGYYGADCSITAKELTASTLNVGAKAWEYFKTNSIEDFEVDITSGSTIMRVYTQENDIPTRSNFTGYYEGSDIKFMIRGSNKTHFIAVFNTHLNKTMSISMGTYPTFTQPMFMIYICIGLALILLALVCVNLYICFKKKKGVQYVGINESGESNHLI